MSKRRKLETPSALKPSSRNNKTNNPFKLKIKIPGRKKQDSNTLTGLEELLRGPGTGIPSHSSSGDDEISKLMSPSSKLMSPSSKLMASRRATSSSSSSRPRSSGLDRALRLEALRSRIGKSPLTKPNFSGTIGKSPLFSGKVSPELPKFSGYPDIPSGFEEKYYRKFKNLMDIPKRISPTLSESLGNLSIKKGGKRKTRRRRKIRRRKSKRRKRKRRKSKRRKRSKRRKTRNK